MKGYWQRPDESKKVLTDDGWLMTGDVGQIEDDGRLRIVDRKKDMILVSGFNVYPNEVENIIAAHPGVLEVAVIGVPADATGEAVKAYVVKKDAGLTEKDIIDHCRKQLTAYKVPRMVEFRTDLPKTNVGKILRKELNIVGSWMNYSGPWPGEEWQTATRLLTEKRLQLAQLIAHRGDAESFAREVQALNGAPMQGKILLKLS